MSNNLAKVLFWGGIIYYIVSVYTGIESTLHFNATQYVIEGEDPEPIRIAELIRDVISPAFNALVLIALSYVVKGREKEGA